MLPALLADVNVAPEVVAFLRDHGVDVVSAAEEGWAHLPDWELLARATSDRRFVLTHDADFGTLAMARGQRTHGIVFLRPGGRPPADVIADLRDLMRRDADWTPPLIAVYRRPRLRLRRL